MTLADPPLAATAIAAADRIVIKIGSSLLVDRKTNAVDLVRLRGLAADIAGFRADGKQVLVVSSGAVALGRRRLGSRARGTGLEKKQASAAAGQSMLMHAWESVFDPHDVITAQILLTRDDTETRRRWLNARATVGALLTMGAVPILNENDTVVTEQIKYGDNDRLAARVAQMISADLLILLSDVDGVGLAIDQQRGPDLEDDPVRGGDRGRGEGGIGESHGAQPPGVSTMVSSSSAGAISPRSLRTSVQAARSRSVTPSPETPETSMGRLPAIASSSAAFSSRAAGVRASILFRASTSGLSARPAP